MPTDQPDATAPLSADELRAIKAAATTIQEAKLTDGAWDGDDVATTAYSLEDQEFRYFMDPVALVLNALPRLVASAEREAALREAIGPLRALIPELEAYEAQCREKGQEPWHRYPFDLSVRCDEIQDVRSALQEPAP